MNKAEFAVCRIKEKLPGNQGVLTKGSGCVVHCERVSSSWGWKCQNFIVTSSVVLCRNDFMSSDKTFIAEFLSKDKKGLEIFELKSLAEDSMNVTTRNLDSLMNLEEHGRSLSFISVEPLDKRGFFKKMVKKSTLQTFRPLECFDFQTQELENELTDGLYCHVIKGLFQSNAGNACFDTQTLKFVYDLPTRQFNLQEFAGFERRYQTSTDIPTGAVVTTKKGEFVGLLDVVDNVVCPLFLPQSVFTADDEERTVNNNTEGVNVNSESTSEEMPMKEGHDLESGETNLFVSQEMHLDGGKGADVHCSGENILSDKAGKMVTTGEELLKEMIEGTEVEQENNTSTLMEDQESIIPSDSTDANTNITVKSLPEVESTLKTTVESHTNEPVSVCTVDESLAPEPSLEAYTGLFNHHHGRPNGAQPLEVQQKQELTETDSHRGISQSTEFDSDSFVTIIQVGETFSENETSQLVSEAVSEAQDIPTSLTESDKPEAKETAVEQLGSVGVEHSEAVLKEERYQEEHLESEDRFVSVTDDIEHQTTESYTGPEQDSVNKTSSDGMMVETAVSIPSDSASATEMMGQGCEKEEVSMQITSNVSYNEADFDSENHQGEEGASPCISPLEEDEKEEENKKDGKFNENNAEVTLENVSGICNSGEVLGDTELHKGEAVEQSFSTKAVETKDSGDDVDVEVVADTEFHKEEVVEQSFATRAVETEERKDSGKDVDVEMLAETELHKEEIVKQSFATQDVETEERKVSSENVDFEVVADTEFHKEEVVEQSFATRAVETEERKDSGKDVDVEMLAETELHKEEVVEQSFATQAVETEEGKGSREDVNVEVLADTELDKEEVVEQSFATQEVEIEERKESSQEASGGLSESSVDDLQSYTIELAQEVDKGQDVKLYADGQLSRSLSLERVPVEMKDIANSKTEEVNESLLMDMNEQVNQKESPEADMEETLEARNSELSAMLQEEESETSPVETMPGNVNTSNELQSLSPETTSDMEEIIMHNRTIQNFDLEGDKIVPQKVAADSLLSDTVTNNLEALRDLGLCLNTEYQYGRVPCWRDLADLLGIPPEVYEHCSAYSDSSPTEDLFAFLAATKPQLTMKDLKEALRQINRCDVVHLLDRKTGSGTLSDETFVASLIERQDTEIVGQISIKLDKKYRSSWKHLALQLNVPRRVFRNFGTQSRHNPSLMLLKFIPIFDPELTINDLKDFLESIERRDVMKIFEGAGIPGDDQVKDILDDTNLLDQITDLLNEDPPCPNWRQLAQKLKIPHEKCKIFEPAEHDDQSPTTLLFRTIEKFEPDLTFEELILALVAMKRQDVLDVLQKYFSSEDIDQILEENNLLAPLQEKLDEG